MSTLTLLDAIERPPILGPDRDGLGHGHEAADHDRHLDPGRDHDHERHLGDPLAVGGAPTLDDLLTGTWSALTSGRAAACPLCDGHLEPRFGAGHNAVSGRCTRCGTELS
jgi:hypothetical protein